MVKVQFISSENCAHCMQAWSALEKIKKDKQETELEKVDMLSEKGQKMVQEYGIMASPGIVIDGKLAFQGGATEEQLRKVLEG
ncbi:thioredoxin family protein [Candidatus Daviesbacteria bacterium]|nr:thioredoxin family protein [Candidatus Daviesbacteria bacterium]